MTVGYCIASMFFSSANTSSVLPRKREKKHIYAGILPGNN